MSTNVVGRRQLLSMGAVAAGAVLVGPSGSSWMGSILPTSSVDGVGRWSDPGSWGSGRVPGVGEWVSVDRPVLLDGDVEVGGLAVQPGGVLVFDPDVSCSLVSSGNVVVLGVLQMRPAAPSVEHVVRFVGVDESRFVGGGMSVVDSDVGLWCMNQGALDVAGSVRRAWARAASDVPAGVSSVVLQAEPVGWQVGDEIAIVPSGSPDESGHHDRYDYAMVTSVSANTVGLSSATKFAHPVVDVGDGVVVAPEVLNLTRNVRFEGTPGGRSHVFVMTPRRQHMSYFSSRYVAPLTGVSGRYGLHLHMGGDAMRGSQVVGAVVRDAGGHAIVPHASHGVTFTSCVTHDTLDHAYWWDPPAHRTDPVNDTNDVVYESCVASRVRFEPDFRGYRLSGFNLRDGVGNKAFNCVAVGVGGNVNSSGFQWPETSREGVWEFRNCVSHNNAFDGIFTWQNSDGDHVIEDFVGYHNGKAGIEHGAYVNAYQYRNGYLYGNKHAAVELHSNSSSKGPQRFVGLHCDGGGRYDHAVRVVGHTLDPWYPTEFVACTFNGQRREALGFVAPGNTAEWFDLVDCVSATPLMWLADGVKAGSIIRVQTGDTALAATPTNTAGTHRTDWNASTNPIQPFAPTPSPRRPITPITGSVLKPRLRLAMDHPAEASAGAQRISGD